MFTHICLSIYVIRYTAAALIAEMKKGIHFEDFKSIRRGLSNAVKV